MLYDVLILAGLALSVVLVFGFLLPWMKRCIQQK